MDLGRDSFSLELCSIGREWYTIDFEGFARFGFAPFPIDVAHSLLEERLVLKLRVKGLSAIN